MIQAQIEKDGEEVTVLILEGNNVLVTETYDLTVPTELEQYAQILIDHIGGGGIKKANG